MNAHAHTHQSRSQSLRCLQLLIACSLQKQSTLKLGVMKAWERGYTHTANEATHPLHTYTMHLMHQSIQKRSRFQPVSNSKLHIHQKCVGHLRNDERRRAAVLVKVSAERSVQQGFPGFVYLQFLITPQNVHVHHEWFQTGGEEGLGTTLDVKLMKTKIFAHTCQWQLRQKIGSGHFHQ